MLEDIKRAVTGAVNGPEDWGLDQQLEFDDEEENWLTHSFSEPASTPPRHAHPQMGGSTDYYIGLVRASIESNGKFGDHKIPTHWLRMILAGLEGKDRGIEPMLTEPRTEEPSLQSEDSRLGPATYLDIFPGQ
jgi:hypothetical protein